MPAGVNSLSYLSYWLTEPDINLYMQNHLFITTSVLT